MTGLTALLGFATWTLLLILIVLVYRSALVMAGRRPANAWPRGEPRQDPPIVQRIEHAHLNALESLPIFASIVLAAYIMEDLEALHDVGPWILLARVAQSTTHIIGTSARLVFIRGSLFGIQVALFAYLLWTLLG